jgi:ATPase family associated with various cellular activities (AAA)
MQIPHRFSPSLWAGLDGDSVQLLLHPLEHLVYKNWHQISGTGNWDTEGLRRDHLAGMFHSISYADPDPVDDSDTGVDTFAFKVSDEVVASFMMRLPNHGRLDLWAATPELAQEHFVALRSKYGRAAKRRRQRAATLLMLKAIPGGMGTEAVLGVKNLLSGRDDLTLHYGAEFASWAAGYVRTLRSEHSGLTIFRGPPGTGKTSFLRYLIHKLKRTHAFYYLPVSHYGMLSDPAMAQFWIHETLARTGIKKVIILEDAEPLLLERSGDNWRHLSNLLNVSDGLLGEFLRVHILCTMNADAAQIDPAVLRSGRLLASREFGRLRAEDARKLAAAKGLRLPLQEDYSLAEIYHGSDANSPAITPVRRVGFQIAC